MSYIYFIEDSQNKTIKIGISKKVLSRFKNLQTSNSNSLNLIGAIPGDYSLESQLHSKFKKYRINGEWFKKHKDILSYIKSRKDFISYQNLLHSKIEDYPLISFRITNESEKERLKEAVYKLKQKTTYKGPIGSVLLRFLEGKDF